jgi:hypothetical protein
VAGKGRLLLLAAAGSCAEKIQKKLKNWAVRRSVQRKSTGFRFEIQFL